MPNQMLPQLNPTGHDYMNSMLKAKAMEQSDQNIQNTMLQNQILQKKLDQPAQTDKEKFEFIKSVATMARDYIPMITKDNYSSYLEWNEKHGVPTEFFPKPEKVMGLNDEEFNKLKMDMMTNADHMLKMDFENSKRIGETREIKKGDKFITEEFNGVDWEEKAKAERWSPSQKETGQGDKQPTAKYASKRLVELAKERANIEKGGNATEAMLALVNPELAKRMNIGQPVPEDIKAMVIQAIEQEEKYLNQFVPDNIKKSDTKFVYEGGKLIQK